MDTAHLLFRAAIVVLTAAAGLGVGYLLCRISEGGVLACFESVLVLPTRRLFLKISAKLRR